jgi:hypothetical protein
VKFCFGIALSKTGRPSSTHALITIVVWLNKKKKLIQKHLRFLYLTFFYLLLLLSLIHLSFLENYLKLK